MAIAQLNKQKEIEPRKTREDLVLFLSKALSLHEILGLQRQISANIAVLNAGATALKTELEINITEGLDELATTIEQEPGTLWLAVPGQVIKFTKAERLREDYGQAPSDIEGGAHELFAIPTENITAVQGRSLPTANARYEPSLDGRIQATHDRPLSRYVEAGIIETVPSPGRWHRFPLGEVALMLASP